MIGGWVRSEYAFEVSAAGRVNIIGEHIDYCGGKVFPAALSLKNTVLVRPNGTDRINVSWTTLPDKVSLKISELDSYRRLKYGNYQAGSALEWLKAGHKVVGCDMIHDCTVPFGSGLSSSAAIEVSTIAALAAVAGESMDKREVAILAREAERNYVGVNCGIMDQYASACGVKGHAMLLDCKSVTSELVPVELGGYSLVIINCNKPHNLAVSAYNERREESALALKTLAKYIDASTLADISAQDFEKYASVLPELIRKRARHVVTECARVIEASKAMKNGDMKYLGALLNASHYSLKNDYEVTGPELDALTDAARSHPACVGSRMTGAGFGGCAISLVESGGVKDFEAYVQREYARIVGYLPSVYNAEIDDGIIIREI